MVDVFFFPQVSNEKNPWLFRVYRGWDPTQLYRDYNMPFFLK